MQLTPALHIVEELQKDYEAMRNMIYGDYPDFDQIMECLESLEEEIHNLK